MDVLYNHQPLCIAARQTYDINSQNSPVDTRDHQWNCRAGAIATPASWTTEAGPAPQSFVGVPIHYAREADNAGEERRGRRCDNRPRLLCCIGILQYQCDKKSTANNCHMLANLVGDTLSKWRPVGRCGGESVTAGTTGCGWVGWCRFWSIIT